MVFKKRARAPKEKARAIVSKIDVSKIDFHFSRLKIAAKTKNDP